MCDREPVVNPDHLLPPGPLPDALCRAVADAEPEPVLSFQYGVGDVNQILDNLGDDRGVEYPSLSPIELSRVRRLIEKRADHVCGLLWDLLEEAVGDVLAERAEPESPEPYCECAGPMPEGGGR